MEMVKWLKVESHERPQEVEGNKISYNIQEVEVDRFGEVEVKYIYDQAVFDDSVPEAARQAMVDKKQLCDKKTEAQKYLDETDWYTARLAETGVAVPQEIQDKRQACRDLL